METQVTKKTRKEIHAHAEQTLPSPEYVLDF